jgi:RCC1 and BTB domain-containing protein
VNFFQVFALGSNGAGCHGVGDMNSSLTPRKIEALSQKKLLDFAYGVGPHVLALTNAGEIVCLFIPEFYFAVKA